VRVQHHREPLLPVVVGPHPHLQRAVPAGQRQRVAVKGVDLDRQIALRLAEHRRRLAGRAGVIGELAEVLPRHPLFLQEGPDPRHLARNPVRQLPRQVLAVLAVPVHAVEADPADAEQEKDGAVGGVHRAVLPHRPAGQDDEAHGVAQVVQREAGHLLGPGAAAALARTAPEDLDDVAHDARLLCS
jgi:hypothetical protein